MLYQNTMGESTTESNHLVVKSTRRGACSNPNLEVVVVEKPLALVVKVVVVVEAGSLKWR